MGPPSLVVAAAAAAGDGRERAASRARRAPSPRRTSAAQVVAGAPVRGSRPSAISLVFVDREGRYHGKETRSRRLDSRLALVRTLQSKDARCLGRQSGQPVKGTGATSAGRVEPARAPLQTRSSVVVEPSTRRHVRVPRALRWCHSMRGSVTDVVATTGAAGARSIPFARRLGDGERRSLLRREGRQSIRSRDGSSTRGGRDRAQRRKGGSMTAPVRRLA